MDRSQINVNDFYIKYSSLIENKELCWYFRSRGKKESEIRTKGELYPDVSTS